MYYTYILKSVKDHKLYTGQTDDLPERLELHNAGLVPSTKHRAPFQLVYYEEFQTRQEARWREYQLKHHSDKMNKVKPLFKESVALPQRGAAPEGLCPGGGGEGKEQ